MAAPRFFARQAHVPENKKTCRNKNQYRLSLSWGGFFQLFSLAYKTGSFTSPLKAEFSPRTPKMPNRCRSGLPKRYGGIKLTSLSVN
jgi:hypothetical protein